MRCCSTSDAKHVRVWLRSLGFESNANHPLCAGNVLKLRALAVKPLMKKQYLWVYVMLYSWAINIVRISILVLYLTIFTKGSGQVRLRIAVYTMATFTLIYTVICFIAILLLCNPISRTWNIWGRRHNGICLDYHTVSLSTAVIVPVLDTITIAIPIYPVWQMVASRWEKMLLRCSLHWDSCKYL